MTNQAASDLAKLLWSRIPKENRKSPNPAGRPRKLEPCPKYKNGFHQVRNGICKCGYVRPEAKSTGSEEAQPADNVLTEVKT